MKPLLTIIMIASLFSVSALKAQNKAQQDDNHFINTAQSQTTVGKNTQTHYKLTNINSVSMDFSLYKQTQNGSWDVVHHLDLKPGQTYEDASSFTGYNGKYVVYSAPHSDWASFPNSTQIAAAQAGSAMPPPAPAPAASQAAPATANPTPAATPASDVPATNTRSSPPGI